MSRRAYYPNVQTCPILAPLVIGLLLTGCATLPSGPSVMVLPGTGKSLEQFQADDLVCRQWAAGSYAVQPQYDMAYMQCMYVKGNQIPVARGSEPGYAPSPPPPAVAPLPPGIPSPPAGAPPPPPPGT